MERKKITDFISKKDFQNENSWGLTASFDLADCNPKLITNPEEIKRFIIELCNLIKMVRHGEPIIDCFGGDSLEGYSAIQFIETSSITIHFDDKIGNRAFIDIFSCEYFDQKKAIDFSKKYFQGKLKAIRIYTRS